MIGAESEYIYKRRVIDAELTGIRDCFKFLRHNLRKDDPLRPLVGGRGYLTGDHEERAPLCRCGAKRSWNTYRGEFRAYCDDCQAEQNRLKSASKLRKVGV